MRTDTISLIRYRFGDKPIKALSVRQPWAWAILHAGKDVENRAWSTAYRGPVLIHASKGMGKGEYYDAARFITKTIRRPVDDEWLARWLGVCAAPYKLKRGGIIGMVDVVDCVNTSKSPWFFGHFGFVLANPTPLPFIPCRGKLSFFAPDLSEVAHV